MALAEGPPWNDNRVDEMTQSQLTTRRTPAGRYSLITLILLAGILTRPEVARAQGTSGAPAPPTKASVLAGRVRDQLGHPIGLAAVSAEQGASAVSGDSGIFRLVGLLPGQAEITVARIGYAPVRFAVTMPADSTVFVEVHMESVTSLAAVEISGRPANSMLTGQGFYERKRLDSACS